MVYLVQQRFHLSHSRGQVARRDESASGFDFATKVGVAHGVFGHQVDAPPEQVFKGVAKIKIPIGV